MERTVNITYWLDELEKATPVVGYENINKATGTSTVTHNQYNPTHFDSSRLVHCDTVKVFVERMARALNLKVQDRDDKIEALTKIQCSHDSQIVHKNFVINKLEDDLKKGQARYQELSQQYNAKVNRLANVGIDLTDYKHRLALCREALSGETLASFQLKRENAELRDDNNTLQCKLRQQEKANVAIAEKLTDALDRIGNLQADILYRDVADTRRAVQSKPEIRSVRSVKPETFGVQPHSVGSTYPLIIVGGVEHWNGATKNVWWVRFGDLESIRYTYQKTAERVAHKFATLIQTDGWDKAKAAFERNYTDN